MLSKGSIRLRRANFDEGNFQNLGAQFAQAGRERAGLMTRPAHQDAESGERRCCTGLMLCRRFVFCLLAIFIQVKGRGRGRPRHTDYGCCGVMRGSSVDFLQDRVSSAPE